MNSLQVCCGEFIRMILFLLNFIFWAAGGAILGIGIYVKVSIGKLPDANVSEDTLNSASLFLITLGCIVFVIGLLGCCGSLTQNRCMLLLYFSLVTIIFLVEIVLAITIYVKKDSVEDVFTNEFRDCMSQFYNETAPLQDECKDVVNTFQTTLKCCGALGPDDWKTYSNSSTTPPPSCCAADQQDSCDYEATYTEGCIGVIENFVNSNTQYIGFGVLAIAVIQLLGMLFACYLRTLILKRTVYEEPHSL